MLRPVGQIAYFYAQFTEGGAGKTGLSDVTFTISRDIATTVKTGEAGAEVSASRHPGLYYYALPAVDADTAGDHIATAHTDDSDVDNQDVPCLVVLSGQVIPTATIPGVAMSDQLTYLLRALRLRLDDLEGGAYIDEDLTSCINWALRDTELLGRCHVTSEAIVLVAGTDSYAPTYVFDPIRVTRAGVPLEITSYEKLLLGSMANPEAGVPARVAQKTGDYLVFSPTPAAVECDFDADADTVVLAAHGLPDATALQFAEINTTTGITTLTTYYVVNAASGTFQVAATAGGTPLTLTGDGDGSFVVGAVVEGYGYSAAMTSGTDRPTSIPTAYRVPAILARAEQYAREMRSSDQYNLNVAAKRDAEWQEYCRLMREATQG